MPLIIVAQEGDAPEPQFVPIETVVQKAREVNAQNAELALAITRSSMRTDITGLRFKLLRPGDLSFDFGTLLLTLKQEMFVSELLSPCARRKWIAHENGHVMDNQKIVTQMDAAIRADALLHDVLNDPFPIASLEFIKKTLLERVGAIFQELNRLAVATRDTKEEYMRVQRDVLQNCPETYIYEVNKNDTLSIIANFFYGRVSAWKSIYRENKGVIGGNPDKIMPGQLLRIPRKP